MTFVKSPCTTCLFAQNRMCGHSLRHTEPQQFKVFNLEWGGIGTAGKSRLTKAHYATPQGGEKGHSNDEAPSVFQNPSFRYVRAHPAFRGFLVVEPDYLGYGASVNLRHPYNIASAYGLVVEDAIRAARHFCKEQSITLNGKLFLDGYSEGGFATLAALKYLEENPRNEIKPIAVAAGGGAYDLCSTGDCMFSGNAQQGLGAVVGLSFIMTAYHFEYGKAKVNLDHIFKKPYATKMPALFKFDNNHRDISKELPPTMGDLLNPSFVEEWKKGGQTELRKLLKLNSVHEWKPSTPVLLYYMRGDKNVPPANTLNTFANFSKYGSKVKLEAAEGDHEDFIPFIYKVQSWFEEYNK